MSPSRTVIATLLVTLLACDKKGERPPAAEEPQAAKVTDHAHRDAEDRPVRPSDNEENSALMFFNDLSARLDVSLTEETEAISPSLMNQKAPSDARIRSIDLEATVFENETFRPLTEGEYEQVVLRAPSIRLRGEAGEAVEHKAPNGNHFTVRELLEAVEETERRTRAKTEWFGGIDVHHVFFEGISQEPDGTWAIEWGS